MTQSLQGHTVKTEGITAHHFLTLLRLLLLQTWRRPAALLLSRQATRREGETEEKEKEKRSEPGAGSSLRLKICSSVSLGSRLAGVCMLGWLVDVISIVSGSRNGFGRGAKQPFLSLGTFTSTLSQRRDAGGRGLAAGMTGGLSSTHWLRHGRELPPICSDVRQKQRLSIDTLPPEAKAPFPPDPVIPLRTKTAKEFQRRNRFYDREANGSFHTIDDSGVNAKFVNAVYDALLSTPQDIQKSVLKGIINSLLREWKGVTSRTCPDSAGPSKVTNAANSVSSTPIMPFTDFYNITLEHIDFMEEYRTWQNYGNSNRFSFCQFPFILSTVVKKAIIQKDSEQQMISQARQSLVSKVSRRQRVDMNLLFLNIKVRRAQLLSDSLDELTRKRCDLKKKLRVTFVGEAGLDMGGLTKECLRSCLALIISTSLSLCPDGLSRVQQHRSGHPLPPLLLQELAHGLGELLSYEGNVEEDFYLTFQVFQEEMGVVKSHNLKPGGDKIPVTKQNRKELDMSALQKAAQYEGYSKTETTVRCFWDVVLAFPLELQKKLLHFTTGSDRVPVGGMADLNFKISKIDVPIDWLPISHTCFNQICLPMYRTRKELKHKLTIAISNAEGFGL
ncbi:hypothetical protein FQN60_014683, partial [Etheostoma spectabile]